MDSVVKVSPIQSFQLHVFLAWLRKKWSAKQVRRLLMQPGSVIFSVAFAACARVLQMHYQRYPRLLQPSPDVHKRKPFIAFTGAGLAWAYYHGVVMYLRDHFYLDNIKLSAISGGCPSTLCLAMGLDLYQVVLWGLHIRNIVIKQGAYLFKRESLAQLFKDHLAAIGITDEDCARLSAKQQLFIGVTQCFPPKHESMNVPDNLDDLVDLWVCSMCVFPFLRTPGKFQGKMYVDGGFSAVWSVPPGQPWSEVFKVTCVPSWCTLPPPAMALADIQPSSLARMLPYVFIPLSWKKQQEMIKTGYEHAKAQHKQFLAAGLMPLPDAPLTPWSQWEQLYADLDDTNLPPLSTKRSTKAQSPLETVHDEILKTHSHSNLADCLQGPRLRRPNLIGGSPSACDVRQATSDRR
eukprot:TRINITY_DN6277_c0_g1_i1.p1 TRINITY_DN6277_c0_g1~~TRINITY_DN6277_c0_g1_i1.p1  ORF type:complete len:424 (+),score=40.41 TRINITY_DN6277_c0_g1_i1:56-1273(+)